MTNRRSLSLLGAALLLPLAAMAGDGLALVPPDATTVGVAHLAQLRTSPLAAKLFGETDRMTIDGEGRKFLEEIGLEPTKDVDVVTFALVPKADDATDADVMVAFEGRFDPVRIAAFVEQKGAQRRETASGVYYRLEENADDDHPVVAIVNKGLIIAGSEPLVVRALGFAKNGGSSFSAAGGLAQELALISPTASAWVLVDVPRTTRLHDQPDWQGAEDHPARAFASSIKRISTVALWTTDEGDRLSFGATAVSADAETRQLLEDAARGALATWRLAASEKDPEMVNVIRQFKVEQTGGGVTLSGSITGDTLRKFALRHKEQL